MHFVSQVNYSRAIVKLRGYEPTQEPYVLPEGFDGKIKKAYRNLVLTILTLF